MTSKNIFLPFVPRLRCPRLWVLVFLCDTQPSPNSKMLPAKRHSPLAKGRRGAACALNGAEPSRLTLTALRLHTAHCIRPL